jgi:hypothetical protein
MTKTREKYLDKEGRRSAKKSTRCSKHRSTREHKKKSANRRVKLTEDAEASLAKFRPIGMTFRQPYNDALKGIKRDFPLGLAEDTITQHVVVGDEVKVVTRPWCPDDSRNLERDNRAQEDKQAEYEKDQSKLVQRMIKTFDRPVREALEANAKYEEIVANGDATALMNLYRETANKMLRGDRRQALDAVMSAMFNPRKQTFPGFINQFNADVKRLGSAGEPMSEVSKIQSLSEAIRDVPQVAAVYGRMRALKDQDVGPDTYGNLVEELSAILGPGKQKQTAGKRRRAVNDESSESYSDSESGSDDSDDSSSGTETGSDSQDTTGSEDSDSEDSDSHTSSRRSRRNRGGSKIQRKSSPKDKNRHSKKRPRRNNKRNVVKSTSATMTKLHEALEKGTALIASTMNTLTQRAESAQRRAKQTDGATPSKTTSGPNRFEFKPCYNCGKMGHGKKECRGPKHKCAKCGWLGHHENHCDELKETLRLGKLRKEGTLTETAATKIVNVKRDVIVGNHIPTSRTLVVRATFTDEADTDTAKNDADDEATELPDKSEDKDQGWTLVCRESRETKHRKPRAPTAKAMMTDEQRLADTTERVLKGLNCPRGQPRGHKAEAAPRKPKHNAAHPDGIERATVLMLTVTTAGKATPVTGGTRGQFKIDGKGQTYVRASAGRSWVAAVQNTPVLPAATSFAAKPMQQTPDRRTTTPEPHVAWTETTAHREAENRQAAQRLLRLLKEGAAKPNVDHTPAHATERGRNKADEATHHLTHVRNLDATAAMPSDSRGRVNAVTVRHSASDGRAARSGGDDDDDGSSSDDGHNARSDDHLQHREKPTHPMLETWKTNLSMNLHPLASCGEWDNVIPVPIEYIMPRELARRGLQAEPQPLRAYHVTRIWQQIHTVQEVRMTHNYAGAPRELIQLIIDEWRDGLAQICDLDTSRQPPWYTELLRLPSNRALPLFYYTAYLAVHDRVDLMGSARRDIVARFMGGNFLEHRLRQLANLARSDPPTAQPNWTFARSLLYREAQPREDWEHTADHDTTETAPHQSCTGDYVVPQVPAAQVTSSMSRHGSERRMPLRTILPAGNTHHADIPRTEDVPEREELERTTEQPVMGSQPKRQRLNQPPLPTDSRLGLDLWEEPPRRSTNSHDDDDGSDDDDNPDFGSKKKAKRGKRRAASKQEVTAKEAGPQAKRKKRKTSPKPVVPLSNYAEDERRCRRVDSFQFKEWDKQPIFGYASSVAFDVGRKITKKTKTVTLSTVVYRIGTQLLLSFGIDVRRSNPTGPYIPVLCRALGADNNPILEDENGRHRFLTALQAISYELKVPRWVIVSALTEQDLYLAHRTAEDAGDVLQVMTMWQKPAEYAAGTLDRWVKNIDRLPDDGHRELTLIRPIGHDAMKTCFVTELPELAMRFLDHARLHVSLRGRAGPVLQLPWVADPPPVEAQHGSDPDSYESCIQPARISAPGAQLHPDDTWSDVPDLVGSSDEDVRQPTARMTAPGPGSPPTAAPTDTQDVDSYHVPIQMYSSADEAEARRTDEEHSSEDDTSYQPDPVPPRYPPNAVMHIPTHSYSLEQLLELVHAENRQRADDESEDSEQEPIEPDATATTAAEISIDPAATRTERVTRSVPQRETRSKTGRRAKQPATLMVNHKNRASGQAKASHLVLDTGATVSVETAAGNMVHYRRSPGRKMIMNTADGTEMLVLEVGEVPGVGTVAIVPTATDSIVSVPQLTRQGYAVSFNHKKATITGNNLHQPVHAQLGGASDHYMLSRTDLNALIEQARTLVLATATATPAQAQTSPAKAVDAPTSHSDVTQTQTEPQTVVETNVSPLEANDDVDAALADAVASIRLSPEQILRAEQVRILHSVLGHPSDKALSNALCNGLVVGTSLTARDVEHARTHLGPCRACAAGKTHKASFTYTEGEPAARIGERVYADLYFLAGSNAEENDRANVSLAAIRTMLLAVDSFSGMLHITKINDKKLLSVQKALRHILGQYAKNGHRVSELHVDSESVFLAAEDWLAFRRIALKPTPPYQHCQRVERQVRTIKERVRCLMAESPVEIPFILKHEVTRTAVHLLNDMTTTKWPTQTPRMMFDGTRPDMSQRSMVPLGTVGMIDFPEDKECRSRMAVQMGPSPLLPNSNFCYVLDTGRLVLRNKIEPLVHIPATFPWRRQDGMRNYAKPKKRTRAAIRSQVPLSSTGDYAPGNTESVKPAQLPVTPSPTAGATADEDDGYDLAAPREGELVGVTTNQSDSYNDAWDTYDDTADALELEDPQSPPMIELRGAARSKEQRQADAEAAKKAKADAKALALQQKKAQGERDKEEREKRRREDEDCFRQVRQKWTVATGNSSVDAPHQGVEHTAPEQTESTSDPTKEATNPSKTAPTTPNRKKTRGAARAAKRVEQLDNLLQGHSPTRLRRSERQVHRKLALTGDMYPQVGRARTFRISVKQALMSSRSQESKEAIIDEIMNMLNYKVGHYVHGHDIPQSKRGNVIPCFMFLKHKTLPDGTYDKTKARMVGNGAGQKAHMYDMVSSSTVALSSVFMLMNIASHHQCTLASFDIKGAFLHAEFGEKDEVTYIRIPKEIADLWVQQDPAAAEYVGTNGSLLLELDKFIYGLKQSPYKFQVHLQNVLLELGYRQLRTDACLYVKHVADGGFSVLSTHVDDILQVATDLSLYAELKDGLIRVYGQITTTEKADAYLGMRIERSACLRYLRLSQVGLVDKVVEGYPRDLRDRKQYNTPADVDLFEISSHEDASALTVEQKKEFLSVVMTLMYLARLTRPDILLAVTYLASRTHLADSRDRECMRRVIRYLENTRERGVVIHCTDLQLYLKCDASFGTHSPATNCYGHTGYVVGFGQKLSYLHARSGKQKVGSTSSTDSEIIALVEAVKMCVWMRDILRELDISPLRSIVASEDNMSAIHLTDATNSHKRSRHLMTKITYLQSIVLSGALDVVHLATKQQTADVLSKPLQGALHDEHVLSLMGDDKGIKFY